MLYRQLEGPATLFADEILDEVTAEGPGRPTDTDRGEFDISNKSCRASYEISVRSYSSTGLITC